MGQLGAQQVSPSQTDGLEQLAGQEPLQPSEIELVRQPGQLGAQQMSPSQTDGLEQLAGQVPPQPSEPELVRQAGQLGVQQLPPAQISTPLHSLAQDPPEQTRHSLAEQVPHEPPQPSSPHCRPVQAGVQSVTHWPVDVWQAVPPSQVPQSPPQPSGPHSLPTQSGAQTQSPPWHVPARAGSPTEQAVPSAWLVNSQVAGGPGMQIPHRHPSWVLLQPSAAQGSKQALVQSGHAVSLGA